MATYAEFDFWSPTLGAEAARLSMVNEAGEEFYAIVERSEGREWRQRKDRALEALTTAIDAGMEPGQYAWRT